MSGPARLDKAKRAVKAVGGKLRAFYLTMGEYDFVAVWEFPDAETCAKFVLGVAGQGSVVTKTLKAFPEKKYREIMAAL